MSKDNNEQRPDHEENNETELEKRLRDLGGNRPDDEAIERMRGKIKKKIAEVREKTKGNGRPKES